MNSAIHRFFGLLVLLAIGNPATGAQETLTLRQAVNQALGQSPETAIARADSLDARAAASMARTQLLPQVAFTEDMSRGNDPVYAFGTRLRQGRFTQADFALNALKTPQAIGNFSSRISGQWMAFDSFKAQHEIHRADLYRQSAELSAKAVDQQIVFRVVGAYQQVLFAQREIAVAEHEQQTATALLASIDDHVKAGLAVESDSMAAKVNVAARKEELIAANGDLQLAWAALREAMGAPDLKAVELKPIEPHNFPTGVLDEEIAQAAKARPDLNALDKANAAQKAAVGAAKSGFGPRISAYVNWDDDHASFGGSGASNWVAGIQVNLDLLPIGKRAQLARESAAKQKIEGQVSAMQQHLRFEVNQAHIHRETASLQVETALAATSEAAESLRILKNR